jgi:hypothetical protein
VVLVGQKNRNKFSSVKKTRTPNAFLSATGIGDVVGKKTKLKASYVKKAIVA